MKHRRGWPGCWNGMFSFAEAGCPRTVSRILSQPLTASQPDTFGGNRYRRVSTQSRYSGRACPRTLSRQGAAITAEIPGCTHSLRLLDRCLESELAGRSGSSVSWSRGQSVYM